MNTGRGTAGETVFAEIVGVATRDGLTRCFARLFSECNDSRSGQGIAVFICDAAGNGGCGQHTKEQVFHRLSGLNGDYIDVRLAASPINGNESGPLDEDTITAGRDALHAEMASGVGRSGVALALCFRDDLHQNFLERFAAGLFYYRACYRSCFRRWGRILRKGKQGRAEKKTDECDVAGE